MHAHNKPKHSRIRAVDPQDVRVEVVHHLLPCAAELFLGSHARDQRPLVHPVEGTRTDRSIHPPSQCFVIQVRIVRGFEGSKDHGMG